MFEVAVIEDPAAADRRPPPRRQTKAHGGLT